MRGPWFADQAEWAAGDSARRALGLVLREELPTLLDVAGLAGVALLAVAAAAPTTSTSWAWA